MDIYTRQKLVGAASSALLVLLSSCGGGGGGGYKAPPGGNDYPPSSSSMSSAVSSNASSSAVSSSVASSATSSTASSSVSIEAAPVTDAYTNIGSTFAAKGMVSVLLNTGGTLSVQQQDRTGLTLYVFDKDTLGTSNCVSEQCMTAWPPLVADANAAPTWPLTIITRADGNKQWALRDKPLYFWASDTKPGDITGEGVGKVWHVAGFPPVLLNQASINANDGDYLTASGKVWVGVPTDSTNTSFVAEQKDRDNFALYTFDNDTTGVSNCNGACAATWPPLLAGDTDEAEAPYSIIERSMGGTAKAKQWAYHGMPLYFYVGDAAPADTLGKAIPKWHLARPIPTQVAASASKGNYLAAAGLVKSATPVNGDEVTSAVARDGFALYTFDNDTAGATSNCSGVCLTNWPALMAHQGAVATAPYSLIARANGKQQWALNGMPLYFFAADTKAGDVNGDGVGGVWHLARTAPVMLKSDSKGAFFIAHGNLVTGTGTSDSAHNNFTLYTFDQDTPNTTTCFNGCLAVWPALYAATDAKAFGDFTLVVRDSNTGVKQWAYKGKPLYFYAGDAAAGDETGEYGDWHIARP